MVQVKGRALVSFLARPTKRNQTAPEWREFVAVVIIVSRCRSLLRNQTETLATPATLQQPLTSVPNLKVAVVEVYRLSLLFICIWLWWYVVAETLCFKQPKGALKDSWLNTTFFVSSGEGDEGSEVDTKSDLCNWTIWTLPDTAV